MISTRQQLEQTALTYGILPFFANGISGFSVEEMAAPGMLFGENNDYDGCWEWKGPVIRQQTLAYGKFFRRKAGFVSLELLPDFINYRRAAYPLAPDSTEALIAELVDIMGSATSSQLRKTIFENPDDLPATLKAGPKVRRSVLEGPLQRLQMSGRLLITDFVYKTSARGELYGWGVALYSTPELWFERSFGPPRGRTPQESFNYIVDHVSRRLSGVKRGLIEILLK